MADWADRYWNSVDGLRLHYRDYAGPHDRPPILCLPGLTRNARDFEPVAERWAGDWRVICVEFRGRGLSEYDPKPEQYLPPVYAADVLKLLDQLGIADAAFFGTSLGGLVTMLMASTDGERIAGALLNDIGPELDQTGIDRIKGYVGKDTRFANWDEAVSVMADRNRDVYPKWSRGQWEDYAHRVCREEGGQIRFDYDMRIADNFQTAAVSEPTSAWPYLEALKGRPVTILRGARTDLLTVETADRMAAELGGDAELVTVPDVGHTPTFEEPESIEAVDRLLARVLARGA
nr:alpha/beta hydrolase [uncultured Sphingomonas sp.]